ncbi:unnamed protein product [Lepidochelys kempii]
MWPWAFTQRLTDWVTRWLRPAAQTVEQIMDQVILKQFVQCLPDSMQVWVRRHQPGIVEAAVKKTEEYAEANFPPREHWTLRDAEGGKKPHEHPTGKPVGKRWEEHKGTPSRPGQLVCWHWTAGQESHDCPVMNCGVAEFCGWTKVGGPEEEAWNSHHPRAGGEKAPEGSSGYGLSPLLIQRCLVKPHWLIPGERMLVECIHRDGEYCPMAQIPLEVQGRFAWKRVGVIEGLPYPVVLGLDWNPSSKEKEGTGRRPTEKAGEKDLEGGGQSPMGVDPGKGESPQPQGEKDTNPRQHSQDRDPTGGTDEGTNVPGQDHPGRESQ